MTNYMGANIIFPPVPATFPRSAEEFTVALEELFEDHAPFFVIEYDPTDSTYLINWASRLGSTRKSWITQGAMDQLTSTLVMH